MSPSEADQVRGFWEDLGLPGIFDVHTHFMPKNVMDKVWSYFDSVGKHTHPVTPQAPLLPTRTSTPLRSRSGWRSAVPTWRSGRRRYSRIWASMSTGLRS